MKLVETLLVRDEADVIGAQIAFHLNMGVDFVVAIDHESCDGTTDVLEAFGRAGVLRRIEMRGPMQEESWRTELARQAVLEHGADWVINADADQFWWPCGGTLRDVLAAVPDSYGLIGSFDRVFVPRPDDGRHFAERMTLRLASSAPLNDPANTFRPLPRLLHRGDPGIRVSRGSHTVAGTRLVELVGWNPVEVLHFPWRNPDQMARKAGHMWHAFSSTSRDPAAYHEAARRATDRGLGTSHYGSIAVDDESLERGLATGCLEWDTRVRDVLRAIAGASPLPRDFPFTDGAGAEREAVEFPAEAPESRTRSAVDMAVGREANVVRLRRRVDELDGRVRRLERT